MSESKCSICSCEFSINNFPRMMPSCEHSSCTNCLKNIILRDKNLFVICGICNSRQQIPEIDLQYFPKNIALIKVIKQKNDQIQPPRSQSKSKQKRSEYSSQKRKQKLQSPKTNSRNKLQRQSEVCQTHSKQKQILCLNDLVKLCPMCAVFGQHKNHKLKPIPEIQKFIQQTALHFYELKNKKSKIDGIIKNQTFKLELVQKINIKKAEITKQIKEQFASIYEAVQHAQKKAYDDLTKKFKEIYDKINNLVKQQIFSQKQYNKWAIEFQNNVKLSLIEQKLQKKAKFYFDGPLDNISEGQVYLNNLQKCLNQKKIRLQSYPNTVSLEKSDILLKDIYNHISLKIEEAFLTSFHTLNQLSTNNLSSKNNLQPNSQIQNQEIQYNKKPIKVEFSSSQSFLSPMNKKTQNHLSPRKKSIPKAKVKSKPKNLTVKKQQKSEKQEMQATTQKIVQIFCSQQNLQTLDLSSFYLNDAQILQILNYVCQRKQIKCLKLSRNKLTNEGFHKCLDYLRSTTNWNLSFNNLTQQSLSYLIRERQKTPNLRVMNISNNKVNQRKAKSYIQELKKIGIIVTL